MSQSWGDYSSLINVNELTELVRHTAQPMMGVHQLASPPTGKALGKRKGDTVQYTFYPNITTAGGALSENQPVPMSSVTPITANYTVAEYGNALPYTGLLEDLSRLDSEDAFMVALMNDLRKLENTQAYNTAVATDWNAVNGATNEFVTDGTPTVTANDEMDLSFAWYLYQQAKQNNIPFFDGESYATVITVAGSVNLRQDSSLTTMLQEDSGRAALNGEIGRVAGQRFIEDSHALDTSAGASSNGEGLLFGADSLGYEVAVPWEVRREVEDFGRDIKVAYLGTMGWVKLLDQTTHSREHIIHITSA